MARRGLGRREGATLERVEVPRSLRRMPSRLLLLSTLALSAPRGIGEGKDAKFFGIGTNLGGSRVSILGVAVRVDCAHAELGAAGVVDPVLADQQRDALTLLSLVCCFTFGACCFDGALVSAVSSLLGMP